MVHIMSAVLALFLVGGQTNSQQLETSSQSMPLSLRSDAGNSRPVWISAQSSVTPDGHLDPAALDEGALETLKEILSKPESGGCTKVGTVIVDYFPTSRRRDSLDASVDTAETVLEGVVTGISGGFFGGIPGELLRVEPEQRIKGNVDKRVYYAFVPVGNFRLGSRTICKTDSEFQVPPRVGQRVIAMARAPEGEGKDILAVESPADLLLEKADGSFALPTDFTTKEPGLAKLQPNELVGRVVGRS